MTRFTPVGLLTAWLLLPLMGFAQPAKPLRYRLEVGRYAAASGQTPFWLRANQYGLVPRRAPLLTLRLAIGMDYRPTPVRPADSLRAAKPRIDWGWGLQAVFNGGKTNQLLLAQAFLKLKLSPGLEIWAGRREELIGLVDSALSSGSYAWSGNTRPMLKIQLALPDYLPRHALFGVKGVYGHGWFEPGRLFTNLFLHQKALYGRLGKPHWRLKLFGGINHQVMWGGRTDRNLGPLVKQHQLPNRFSDYLHVITARALANQTNLDTTRISGFDRENRIGNHLGSVDVGLEYSAPGSPSLPTASTPTTMDRWPTGPICGMGSTGCGSATVGG